MTVNATHFQKTIIWLGCFGLVISFLLFLTSPTTALTWHGLYSALLGTSIALASIALPCARRLICKASTPCGTTPCADEACGEDMLQHIPDLLWSIDFGCRTVTQLNTAYKDTHPQAADANIRLATLLPARIARLFLESLIEVQNRREMIRFEYQISETDGNSHTFEARLIPGSSRECIAIIREISHIKATEEALINQQIFLQKIVDNSPDLIFVRDRHGRFLLVNRATQATLGHELLTQSHTGLAEDQIPFLTGDHEVLQTGETAEIIEKITLPNGQTRWYSVTKLPLERDGDTYLLCIAVDITHFHASEAAQLGADSFVRAIVENLPLAFVLLENGGIVFANLAACDLLAAKPDDLIGANLASQCEQHGINAEAPRAVDCASIALQLVVLDKASSAA